VGFLTVSKWAVPNIVLASSSNANNQEPYIFFGKGCSICISISSETTGARPLLDTENRIEKLVGGKNSLLMAK